RVVRPLVEGEPRRVGEIGEGDAISRGEWVLPGDEDVRLSEEERAEREPGVPEQLVDDVPVEVVPVEDAKLAAERPDILDDVPRASLPQRELVLGRPAALHHSDERVDHERVMLRRNPEQASRWRPTQVAQLEERYLLGDLPGISEKL